ncbi:response regulator [Streptomyces sp. NPDC042319]|uniref:response regulator n=1 Tax=Streptomyces sp. NPDC042319 TaxID=3154332 RepID=UPI0033DEB01C
MNDHREDHSRHQDHDRREDHAHREDQDRRVHREREERRAPFSVLVVDDDFRVADLHASLVAETPGFTVVGTAHSARAALEEASTHPVDLALVDRYLPDRSGIELMAELSCDVFVLSAAAEGETVRKALSAGALAYLIKPFPPRLLSEKLRGYVRFRQLTDAEMLDQNVIDNAFDALRSPRASRNRQAAAQTVTRELVLAAVDSSGAPLSAGEVAAQIGVSRATAQRYLADLVTRGRLRMRLRYGAAGRPEQEYHHL